MIPTKVDDRARLMRYINTAFHTNTQIDLLKASLTDIKSTVKEEFGKEVATAYPVLLKAYTDQQALLANAQDALDTAEEAVAQMEILKNSSGAEEEEEFG